MHTGQPTEKFVVVQEEKFKFKFEFESMLYGEFLFVGVVIICVHKKKKREFFFTKFFFFVALLPYSRLIVFFPSHKLEKMSDNDDGDFDNALLESINRLEQRQRDGSDTAGSMNQSQSTGDIANALQNLDGNCASSSTTAAGAAGSGSKRQRSHDELQRQPNLEKKTKIENANDFCLQVPTQAHFAEACQCVLNVLSKWFQHDSFRQQQWKIIASTLMGHDGVAVLATGSGKSLTYQFPAVFLRAVSQGMVPGACGKDRSNCWVSIMQQVGKTTKLSLVPTGFLSSLYSCYHNFLLLYVFCSGERNTHLVALQWWSVLYCH